MPSVEVICDVEAGLVTDLLLYVAAWVPYSLAKAIGTVLPIKGITKIHTAESHFILFFSFAQHRHNSNTEVAKHQVSYSLFVDEPVPVGIFKLLFFVLTVWNVAAFLAGLLMLVFFPDIEWVRGLAEPGVVSA